MLRITSLLILFLGVLFSQIDYFAIQRNGLWGMEDRSGQVLIEPSYSNFKVFPKFCLAQDRNQVWTIYFNYTTHQTFRKADQVEWYWNNYIMVREGKEWMLYAINDNGASLIRDKIVSYEVYGSQILLWDDQNVSLFYGAKHMESFDYQDPYVGDEHYLTFEKANGKATEYHTFSGGQYWKGFSPVKKDSTMGVKLTKWNTSGARYFLKLAEDTLEWIHIYQQVKDTLFYSFQKDSSTFIEGEEDINTFYVNWQNRAYVYNEEIKEIGRLSVVKPFFKRLNYTYLLSEDQKELLLWRDQMAYFKADSIVMRGGRNHLRLILKTGNEQQLLLLEKAPKIYKDFVHVHASDTLLDVCQWGTKTRLKWDGKGWQKVSEKKLICFSIQNFINDGMNVFNAPVNTYWVKSTFDLMGQDATNNWGRWNKDMKDFEQCARYTSVESLKDSVYTLCWTSNYCRVFDEIKEKWLFTAKKLLYKGFPDHPIMIYVNGRKNNEKTHFKDLNEHKEEVVDYALELVHEKNDYLWFYGRGQYYLYHLKTKQLQKMDQIKHVEFSIYDNYVFKTDENLYGVISFNGAIKVEAEYYKVERKGKYFELIGHQANYALAELNGTQKTAQIFGVPKVKSHYFTAFDQEKDLYDSNGQQVPKPFGTNVYKEIKGDQYVVRKGKKHYLLNVSGQILYEAKEMVLITQNVIAYFDQGKTCLYNIKTQKKIVLDAWGQIEGVDEQLFLYGNQGQQDLMRISDGKIIVKDIRKWELLDDGNYYFEAIKEKGIIIPSQDYKIQAYKNLDRFERTIDAYVFYTDNKGWVFSRRDYTLLMTLPKGKTKYLGYHRWTKTDPFTQITALFHDQKWITESKRWSYIEPFNQEGIACTDWNRRYGIIDTNAMWVKEPKLKKAIGLEGGYFVINHQLFSPDLKFLSSSVSKVYQSNQDIIIYRDDHYRIGIADAQFNTIYPAIIDKYKTIGNNGVLLGSWEYKMLMDIDCNMLLGGTYQDLQINKQEQTVSVRYFANLYHFDLKARTWIDLEHIYVE